jgi:hypothetical protein
MLSAHGQMVCPPSWKTYAGFRRVLTRRSDLLHSVTHFLNNPNDGQVARRPTRHHGENSDAKVARIRLDDWTATRIGRHAATCPSGDILEWSSMVVSDSVRQALACRPGSQQGVAVTQYPFCRKR